MDKLGRREFLAGTALAVTACRPARDRFAVDKPAVPVPPNLRPGSERSVLSTCGMCPAGCGIRVRVVEGRAVKIDGNPASPVNRGRLCARGQAALELLYHPDRVRGPLRRVGERGANRWRHIGWDRAIDELAFELGQLRAAGEGHSIVLVDGEERDTTHALWARLLRALGSPNHVGHGATGTGAMRRAMAAATGVPALPGYDFENARLVLAVGSGACESSPQAMALARAMGRGSPPRLVCAWPRLPPAGTLVDEWLPLAPGGQAAFLLALAHVLMREGLADDFRVASAQGFAPWVDGNGRRQPGLRDPIMADFAPAKVEARTGVPAMRIEQLARELAVLRPSLVAVDEAAGDDRTAVAAVVVNALLGSLDAVGGMVRDAGWALPGWNDPPRGASPLGQPALDGRPAGAAIEHSRLLALPEAILSGKPYPTNALLLYYSNPVFSQPAGARWQEALAKVPFVVSFSPLFDESARFADLVLPDTTFLERWDIVAPAQGTRTLSLRQPVVSPVEDGLATGEVVLRLAQALGGDAQAALPWPSHREAVVARLAQRTGGAADVLPTLERDGVWSGAPEEAATDEGGAPVAMPIRDLRCPSPLLEVAEETRGLPFTLLPVRGPGYAEGGTRHLRLLAELPLAGELSGPPTVEVATADARDLGIREGDVVLVESSVGRLTMRARVHDGLRAGVLGLPLGGGGWPLAAADAHPRHLLGDAADAHTGQWRVFGTRARVRRLG